MRTSALVVGLMALLLVVPQESRGKIATGRTSIVAVHAPGTAKGMKFGAVTLAWVSGGARPEVITARVMQFTKLTAPGKGGRVSINVKDLKPGLTVAITVSANRIGDTSWMLNSLHVLDLSQPPDPALLKLLGASVASFIGRVARVGKPPAEPPGYVGQIELKRGKDTFTFHVARDTEIVRQAADGKQRPITFGDLKVGSEVVAMYAGPLATGKPPQAPAARVILLDPVK
jgi:hypothetical protein